MAEQKDLKPNIIQPFPFPSGIQKSGTLTGGESSENLFPSQIEGLSFPISSVATGLRSTSLNTETRTINSNFTFQPLGAISIGTVRGTGTSLSGSGIRISPLGIYGYSNGVVKFSLSNTGVLVTSGYIQVGGAAADVNGGTTTIGAGKILISGSTTLSNWSAGGDATYIDGGKLYTGTVTADTVRASWVYAGNISADQINAGSLSADRISGGTLQVGGSSDSLGTIVVKNTSGTEITKLNNSGIIVRNTRGLFFEGTSSGHYWDLQVDSSNNSVMSLADSDAFYMKNYAGSTNLFTVSSSNGGYLDKQGYIMGNGSSDNTKPRIIKCGSVSGSISGDSYKDISISFGYTFGSDNPFVTATVSGTSGTLGGVHEWNVGLDSFSTSGCNAKCRHVNYANGTGTIYVDWIAVGRTS